MPSFLIYSGAQLDGVTCPTLQSISMRSVPSVGNETVLTLLPALPHLKILDLSFCYDISDRLCEGTKIPLFAELCILLGIASLDVRTSLISLNLWGAKELTDSGLETLTKYNIIPAFLFFSSLHLALLLN